MFLITTGSSMQAIILTGPPHSRQISTSMLNTRFKRWAQVIEARRSVGVCSSAPKSEGGLFLFPRLPGVTCARCLARGDEHSMETGQIHSRLRLPKAASRAMNPKPARR